MDTHYLTRYLGKQTLHFLYFDPTTFTRDDLLYLPHHSKLVNAVIKRKAEHLAGRIAASYAIKSLTGRGQVIDMGLHGEPLWPKGIKGSLSHNCCCAIAIATIDKAITSVGIDIETIIDESEAKRIWQVVLNNAERQSLIGWPFPLAITLAFSAKESLYKALCYDAKQGIDFFSSQIINITHNTLTLELTNDLAGHIKGERWRLYWQQQGTQVITLVCH
ncbi:enterobactin synthase subunit EntD [Providencia manganoxydans]|uniref:enterobactin synthase subunit EntD n=1 Tax=Providencia manganoxydans TaxID=2923283 RepID=UPI0032DAEFB3